MYGNLIKKYYRVFNNLDEYIPIRYGVKHGLTFALPVRTGPIPISSKNLPPEYHGSPDGRYNMVVSHTQFNKAGAQQVSLCPFIGDFDFKFKCLLITAFLNILFSDYVHSIYNQIHIFSLKP